MAKTKLTKQSKKGTEIPNSVALIILVSAAAGSYFWINGGINFGAQSAVAQTSSRPAQAVSHMAAGTVTTMSEVDGTKHYVHKVPNPKKDGAPTLILPDVRTLSIYRSEQIQKSVEYSTAKQDSLIAEAKLKEAEANKRKKILEGDADNSNYFGEGSTQPKVMTIQPTEHDDAMAKLAAQLQAQSDAERQTMNQASNRMSLVSISRLNGELEAMFNYGGEPVSIDKSGVTYSAASNLPSLSVRSITDNEVCLSEAGKTNCYKVY